MKFGVLTAGKSHESVALHRFGASNPCARLGYPSYYKEPSMNGRGG
jgi:hypothetical protein